MRPVSSLPTVLALWVAGLCAAAQFAKIGLVLPELGAVYPEAGAALGFLVSSVSVVGVLFGLVAGLLAARLGLRRLLLGGLALGAAVSLVQASLPPLPVLIASRVLEGVSHLAIVVTAPTLVATTSATRWRPAAMTLWGTFFGVAFALTAWLGLPLVETHGPGALFLAHGACTAAVAALLAVVLPGRNRVVSTGTASSGTASSGAASTNRVSADRVSAGRMSAETNPARPSPTGESEAAGTTAAVKRTTSPRSPAPHPFSPRGLLRRHARAWTSPFVAAPAAGWLFYTITFVALLAVLPSLLPPADRAFVATAMPLASIVSSMTIGVALLRRLDAVRVIGIGFAAAAAVAATLPLLPGEPLACIALFAALGLVQGASFASVPELNPDADAQALANGTLAQAGNLGNACGTPLLLALLGAGGFGTMMALVVACYAAAIAAHALLARRRRASLAPA